jgi:hypothetical protein
MTQSPARTTGVYGPRGAVDFAVFFEVFFADFFTVFFAVFFAVAMLPAYRATASERK